MAACGDHAVGAPDAGQLAALDEWKAAANAINVLKQSCDDADQRARYNGLGAANARERSDTITDVAQIMAKILMADAFAAAGKATGGKAVGSITEDHDGVFHFEVTVLKGKARQKVLVDTQTGLVEERSRR